MRRFLKILLVALFIFSRFPALVFADYRLYDAIEEFGEHRYVKPETPANLKAGPVRIHPSLRTRAAYDSNILFEDEDAREDVVFNVKPGAILELPIDKHQIAVGYEADFENFVKKRDHSQNDQNQSFFALADFRFPSFYINALDKLEATSSRAGTTFTSRIPRIDHTINPKVGYHWKRLTFETGYNNFIRNFRHQGNEIFDFKVNEWNAVIFYDLFARLKALMEYQLGKISYDNNESRDGLVNQFRLGLEGEIIPHLVLKARGGMQFRNYYYSSETDFNSWVASLSAEYAIRSNIRLKADLSREPLEANFQEVNFYIRHSVGLGIEYDIHPRWTVFGGAKYFKDFYRERATVQNMTGFRRDKHVGLNTGLRYNPREWWKMELAYEFLHRTSNFPGQDYNENLVYISSAFVY